MARSDCRNLVRPCRSRAGPTAGNLLLSMALMAARTVPIGLELLRQYTRLSALRIAGLLLEGISF
jgi:hypothetical protein